jgi:hypothetical protein
LLRPLAGPLRWRTRLALRARRYAEAAGYAAAYGRLLAPSLPARPAAVAAPRARRL